MNWSDFHTFTIALIYLATQFLFLVMAFGPWIVALNF